MLIMKLVLYLYNMTPHIIALYSVLSVFIIVFVLFARGISKLQGKQAQQLKQIRNDVYDINDMVEPGSGKPKNEGGKDDGEKLPVVKPFEHGGV